MKIILSLFLFFSVSCLWAQEENGNDIDSFVWDVQETAKRIKSDSIRALFVSYFRSPNSIERIIRNRNDLLDFIILNNHEITAFIMRHQWNACEVNTGNNVFLITLDPIEDQEKYPYVRHTTTFILEQAYVLFKEAPYLTRSEVWDIARNWYSYPDYTIDDLDRTLSIDTETELQYVPPYYWFFKLLSEYFGLDIMDSRELANLIGKDHIFSDEFDRVIYMVLDLAEDKHSDNLFALRQIDEFRRFVEHY